MKKIKISLAALALTLMVGLSFAANVRPTAIDCSTLPDKKGTQEDHVTAGCTGDQADCCYRLTDNFVFRLP